MKSHTIHTIQYYDFFFCCYCCCCSCSYAVAVCYWFWHCCCCCCCWREYRPLTHLFDTLRPHIGLWRILRSIPMTTISTAKWCCLKPSAPPCKHVSFTREAPTDGSQESRSRWSHRAKVHCWLRDRLWHMTTNSRNVLASRITSIGLISRYAFLYLNLLNLPHSRESIAVTLSSWSSSNIPLVSQKQNHNCRCHHFFFLSSSGMLCSFPGIRGWRIALAHSVRQRHHGKETGGYPLSIQNRYFGQKRTEQVDKNHRAFSKVQSPGL